MTADQMLIPGVRRFDTGDALERHYTPVALADAIVRETAETTPEFILEPPDLIVEPNVGAGPFVMAYRKYFPKATIIGIDLDPDAPGLALCDEGLVGDWKELAAEWKRVLDRGNVFHSWMCQRPCIIGGNPPFDDSIAHVEASLGLRPRMLSYILPLAYWGVQEWTPLLRGRPQRPAVMRPIAGRPWPASVRETCVYEWHGFKPAPYVPGFTRNLPLMGWPL
jgi:hypothetical protein